MTSGLRCAPAVLALLAAPVFAEGPAVPRFVDETATARLDHSYTGEWEFMAGGGATSFDCSGDGLPELVLAGGSSPATLFRNESTPGHLAFRKAEAGVELESVTGAYALDIDSDAITDLILLRVGENVALRGLGDCRFERANEVWGFDGGDGWSTALAATWEKGAIWPSVAIGNYIDRTEEAFPWGTCTDNWLHRGGDKGFAPPLALTPSYCALSMLFTDWNRSGQPALRVSNDREYYKGGQEQLWHLDPGAPPRLYTPAEGWQKLRLWGMGIASHDLTGDGYPDYFLTSMADNKLQTLQQIPVDGAPQPRYADVALTWGVTAHRPHTGEDTNPSTAWHAQFEDVNNDGLVDLFVAKGNVWDMPDFAMRDPNNLLMQEPGGKFTEASVEAGVASTRQARGASLADFDGDGLLDLVVVNRNEPSELWRNATAGAGHWLAVDPRQEGTNRNAVGGWVEVKTGDHVQRREITIGGGHAGNTFGPHHFGLGTATKAEMRVIWPDGTEGAWQTVPADQVLRLTR